MLTKFINSVRFSCREATFLIEKQQSSQLTFIEKLKMNLHLQICDGCSKYIKQSLFLNSLMQQQSSVKRAEMSQLKLSEDAKIRLQKIVNERLG